MSRSRVGLFARIFGVLTTTYVVSRLVMFAVLYYWSDKTLLYLGLEGQIKFVGALLLTIFVMRKMLIIGGYIGLGLYRERVTGMLAVALVATFLASFWGTVNFDPLTGDSRKKWADTPEGPKIHDKEIEYEPSYGDKLKPLTPEDAKKVVPQQKGKLDFLWHWLNTSTKKGNTKTNSQSRYVFDRTVPIKINNYGETQFEVYLIEMGVVSSHFIRHGFTFLFQAEVCNVGAFDQWIKFIQFWYTREGSGRGSLNWSSEPKITLKAKECYHLAVEDAYKSYDDIFSPASGVFKVRITYSHSDSYSISTKESEIRTPMISQR